MLTSRDFYHRIKKEKLFLFCERLEVHFFYFPSYITQFFSLYSLLPKNEQIFCYVEKEGKKEYLNRFPPHPSHSVSRVPSTCFSVIYLLQWRKSLKRRYFFPHTYTHNTLMTSFQLSTHFSTISIIIIYFFSLNNGYRKHEKRGREKVKIRSSKERFSIFF